MAVGTENVGVQTGADCALHLFNRLFQGSGRAYDFLLVPQRSWLHGAYELEALTDYIVWTPCSQTLERKLLAFGLLPLVTTKPICRDKGIAAALFLHWYSYPVLFSKNQPRFFFYQAVLSHLPSCPDLEMAPQVSQPADPLAQGIVATAKQSFRDLFIWRQRAVLSNEYGETRCEWRDPDRFVNPISLFAQLSAKNWLFFIVGFLSWTADAFDFHALSIQTKKLADYYGRSKTDITTAITLTLLLRSVGAAMFGLAGDKWGRKWPMVANMIILGLLQIATIYSSTFSQFLAVRSLFGLFMGGVYGNAMAMSLEQCP